MRFTLFLEARERETYYHVTYLKNLNGIKRQGLIKSARPNFRDRADLAGHSQSGLFLANKQVSYWVNVLENWADHSSDDVVKDGMIPVILKVQAFPDLAKPDTYPGNPQGAWVYPKNIRSQYLEMWTGSQWTADIDKKNVELDKFVEQEETWWHFLRYPFPPEIIE